MLENIKITERTPKEIENENEVLRKLLQEYVAQLEVLKKIYNESALGWEEAHKNLTDKNTQLIEEVKKLSQS